MRIRLDEVMHHVRARCKAKRIAGVEPEGVSLQIEALAEVLVEQINAVLTKLRTP